ncbi:MAG: LysM peptidoglycan-binding domain-containing protein [Deltaproteobacteria bacterium]|nr:LysM peptidoglycan-binding domain-containing protein [Deltaproteobacteria bacterium]
MKRVFDQRVTSGIIIFGLMVLFACVGHAEELSAPLTKGSLAKGPPSAPAKVLDKEMDYTVKKGDTLWDISTRFYGDAFLWPRLWQQNQYITNPHQISPGDRIRLYPYKVLIEVEEKKTATVEEARPLPPPQVAETQPPLPPPPEIIRLTIFPEVNSAGFIAEKMEGIGRIVAAKLHKVLLVDEDEIYISFQKGISVKKGDKFTIFRVLEPIPHPVIKKKKKELIVGRRVIILGTAVITKTSEGEAQTALITRSYAEIIVGDEVTPYFAPREELAVSTVEEPLYGWIVAGQRIAKLEFVEGDVVYIDLGEEDHVRPGHIFNVLRRGAVVEYPVTNKAEKIKDKEKRITTPAVMVKLPDELVARLVVIKTQQKTSTAVIVQTRLSVFVGDEVTTAAE